MSITISQATIHDAPAIASILIDTYAEDAFVPYLLLPEASYQERLDFWTRFVLTGFNHDHHVFYKAVDESTGKIVAFSRLVYPPPTPLGDSYDSNEDITSPVANTPFMEKFFGVLEDHQTRFVDSTTVQIYILGTLKAYRGRGLATRLMKPALDKADEAGARTYLDAFPGVGLSLYRTLGFREVGRTVIGMGVFGGVGEAVIKAMIREPRGA